MHAVSSDTMESNQLGRGTRGADGLATSQLNPPSSTSSDGCRFTAAEPSGTKRILNTAVMQAVLTVRSRCKVPKNCARSSVFVGTLVAPACGKKR